MLKEILIFIPIRSSVHTVPEAPRSGIGASSTSTLYSITILPNSDTSIDEHRYGKSENRVVSLHHEIHLDSYLDSHLDQSSKV